MIELMKKICEEQTSAMLYTNINDTEHFIFGYISAVCDNHIAVKMISPDGYADGILVKDINSVFRVDTGGLYAEKMSKLMSYHKTVPIQCELDNCNIIESLLLLAIKTGKIVSIEINDSGINDIVGIVKKVDKGLCSVRLIDEYGADDGYSNIIIDNITQISYASSDENRIYSLFAGT